MRRVIIESPYKGDIERNVRYARAAMLDCFRRAGAPFASHLLYPQCLDDSDSVAREIGIAAGVEWGVAGAEAIVVYTDLGISEGMAGSIATYKSAEIPIEYRSLPGWS